MTAEQRKAREALAEGTAAAVKVLKKLLASKDERMQLLAAKVFLDRGLPDALGEEDFEKASYLAGLEEERLAAEAAKDGKAARVAALDDTRLSAALEALSGADDTPTEH